MISWLQRTLQRHYKWLFISLLAIVIIPFVFSIGAAPPGIGSNEGKNRKQMYYGYNLNSQNEAQELLLDANISYMINTGMPMLNQKMALEQALMRPPLLSLADSLKIPTPDNGQLINYIKSKPIFLNKKCTFDTKAYNDFIEFVRTNPQLTQGRVRQTLAQDFRIDSVVKSIGGPGFVLPYEAQIALERQETLWSIDIASININDFKSTTKISNSELENYYEEHKFKYALPERVSVTYALFLASDFMSSIKTPSDEELEVFFNSNTELFKKTENEATLKFQDVKPIALMSYKSQKSKQLAAEAGENFIYEIYENGINQKSPEFKDLLKKHGIALKRIFPYSYEKLPTEGNLPKPLLEQAFSLNKDQYYSDIVATNEGSAILFLEEQLPIFIPSLSQVKQVVTNDYMKSQNLKALDSVLRKAVKKGKSFEQTAQSQGLSVTKYDSFKITSPPAELDKLLLSDVQTLNQNQVSPVMINDQLARFIYVRKREKPELSAKDSEVVDLVGKLETFTASTNTQGFLNQMINKELKWE